MLPPSGRKFSDPEAAPCLLWSVRRFPEVWSEQAGRILYPKVLEQLAERVLSIYNSNWFDTLSEEYVDLYESKLGIAKNPSKTLAERRAAIEARWKSSGKITLEMLQAVADSIAPGSTEVTFQDGVIEVNREGQLPGDAIMDAIEELKPAHLPVQQSATLRTDLAVALHGGVLIMYGEISDDT